jgi:DNA-binding HxlR family transcriptional regulator
VGKYVAVDFKWVVRLRGGGINRIEMNEHGKYHFDFWRPFQAIRKAGLDDNPATSPDLTWTPLRARTPCSPRSVLSHRLNRLVDEGILERIAYRRPPRSEYRLTEKVREVGVPVIALMQWGDRHLSEKPPRVARRRSDRSPVRAVFVDRDDEVVSPHQLEVVPGPGLARAR